jgi:hypothetical protein
MRVTIIPSDSIVIVDRVAKSPLDLSFMTGIHAVQWYETWGEVELIDADGRPRNERIESLNEFQPALDLWNAWVAPVPPTPKPDPWPSVDE